MASFNKVMLNKILTEAQNVSGDIIAKGQAQSRLEGTALAASGKGVKEIKEDMSTIERIFGGGATLQAAHEFALKAGEDDYISSINANMSELRTKTPDQFAKEQVNIFSDLMTGDAEMDREIMLRADTAVTAASKAHAKEHAVFTQERALSDYTNRVTKAHARLVSTHGKDEAALEEANSNLLEALKLPSGMDSGAHKEALLALDELFMAKGDDSIHRNLGKVTELLPEDMVAAVALEGLRHKKILSESALSIAKDVSDIEEAAAAGAGDTKLISMLQDVVDRYGEGAVSQGKMTSILTARIRKHTEELTKQEKANLYMKAGGGLNFKTKAEAEEAQEITFAAIREKYKDNPEVAEKLILQKWAQDDTVQPQLKRKTNFVASRPMVNGEPNAQYGIMIAELEPLMQANPDKTMAMFTNKADLQRYLTIRDAVNSEEFDAVSAMRIFEDNDAVKARMEYAKSPEMKKEIKKLAEDIRDGNYNLPLLNDKHWHALQNQPEVLAALESEMMRAAAISGHTDNLADATAAGLDKRYSFINGRLVHTGSKNLEHRLGVEGATADQVMGYFFDTTFKEEFPGYLDTTKIRFTLDKDSNKVVLWLENELGQLTAPAGTAFGRVSYPLDEIGAKYTNEVLIPEQEADALEASEHGGNKLRDALNNLRFINKLTGSKKSEEELEAEARRMLNTESAFHKAGRGVGEGLLWFGRELAEGNLIN